MFTVVVSSAKTSCRKPDWLSTARWPSVRRPRLVLLPLVPRPLRRESLRPEGEVALDGQCSRRLSRNLLDMASCLEGDMRDGEWFREVGPRGEEARSRERPLSVLDSSGLSTLTVLRTWLRCLVRPRMISETCMVEVGSEDCSE